MISGKLASLKERNGTFLFILHRKERLTFFAGSMVSFSGKQEI